MDDLLAFILIMVAMNSCANLGNIEDELREMNTRAANAVVLTPQRDTGDK